MQKIKQEFYEILSEFGEDDFMTWREFVSMTPALWREHEKDLSEERDAIRDSISDEGFVSDVNTDRLLDNSNTFFLIDELEKLFYEAVEKNVQAFFSKM